MINQFLAFVPILYPLEYIRKHLFEQVFNEGKGKNNAGLP